jgi:hypothetical protein
VSKHKDKDPAFDAALQAPDAAELLERIKREQRARAILDLPAPRWQRPAAVLVLAGVSGAAIWLDVPPVAAALAALSLGWLLEESVMRRHLERRLNAVFDLLRDRR